MNGGVSHFREKNSRKKSGKTTDGEKERTKRKEMGECGVIWKVVAARPGG